MARKTYITDRETIKSINHYKNEDYRGFQIKTNRQTITIGLQRNDNIDAEMFAWLPGTHVEDFLGAKIQRMFLGDELIGRGSIEEPSGTIVLNVMTDHGVMQFVACNNGDPETETAEGVMRPRLHYRLMSHDLELSKYI